MICCFAYEWIIPIRCAKCLTPSMMKKILSEGERMKFLLGCVCVCLVFALSSCAAVNIEHCAPVSYKSHRVACFPIDE